MRSPLQMLRRFGRDEKGTLLAETVVILPMLLWAYLALFVYWDAYRAVNTSQKAAYMISDMISREKGVLKANYPTGLRNVMRYLIDSDREVKIRVTSIYWSVADNRFAVSWSRSPDNALPRLTTLTLQDVKKRLPKMADSDTVVLVETEVEYEPLFNIGLQDSVLRQFIVTRPRTLPRICIIDEPNCDYTGPPVTG